METQHLMKMQTEQAKEGTKSSAGEKRKRKEVGSGREWPDHLYNEDGEVDLRRATGDEAYNFFQRQGITLPTMPRSH